MGNKSLLAVGFIFFLLFIPNVRAELIDDIVAYYRLDETNGTIAEDVAGSNDGTVNDPRVFDSETAGIINTGADFTQGTDQIDLGTFDVPNITVSVWINRSNDASAQIIVAKDTNPHTEGDWFLQTGENIAFGIRIDNSFRSVISSLPTPDQWHHVVGSYDGSIVKMYINGTEVGNLSYSGTIADNMDTIYIGRRGFVGAVDFYNGVIDEVGIWNRVLSEVEVAELYNNGTGLTFPFDFGDPPILEPIGNQIVFENQTLTIQLIASDPENDTLTFGIAENLPSPFSFDSATGLFEWTPTFNDAGIYDVTFNVSDGVFSDQETITISVFDPFANNPPVLEPIGNQTVNENQTLLIQLVATDIDPGDQEILVYLSNAGDVLPSPFNLNRFTGLFNWTPTFDDSGAYDITFIVTDGRFSDQETITITVINFNRPPEMQPIADQMINETETLEIQINASDPDGDSITYSTDALNVLPSGFDFNNQTGEFSWIPTFLDAGIYDVQFSISDGDFVVNQNVVISVFNTPYPLIIDPIGDQEVIENDELVIDVDAVDLLNPNATITFFTNAQGVLPSAFTFSSITGIFSWTPGFNESGSYDVTFFATNGEFFSQEEITITVLEGCSVDIDGDGMINTSDLIILLNNFGTDDPASDVNNDGVVNVLDLIELLLHYGQSCNELEIEPPNSRIPLAAEIVIRDMMGDKFYEDVAKRFNRTIPVLISSLNEREPFSESDIPSSNEV